MYRIHLLMVCVLFAASAPISAGEVVGDGEAESNVVEMSAAQRLAAGISIGVAGEHALNERIRLPAEVVVNAYRSASVTTRIVAEVVSRHARLGDVVKSGDRLVTLSGVEMADAQGELLIADREWQRVKMLGKSAVSERRYTAAQVLQRQALAKVLAYGMTAIQAASFIKSGDAALATGQFDLFAPQQGTVLEDDFIVGELIEPGRVLFSITDESTLWVEASAVPSDLTRFEVGEPARVSHHGEHWIDGRIVQLQHRLNDTTRRQGLRIEIDNADDHLHPGEFTEVEISTGDGPIVLAIPDAAITLIRGTPAVFRLQADTELHVQPVEPGQSAGGWTAIESGLTAGDKIAVSGVFTLKSLLLKSSIGDVD